MSGFLRCLFALAVLAGAVAGLNASAQSVTIPAEQPLPVLLIDVGGKTITSAKAAGTLKVIEQHDGSLQDVGALPAALETPIAIELRGDTSVELPKKSYDIELRDARGRDRKLPLLGLPADSDWALHGCGKDKTCLRNALAYSIASDLGRYAPRTRYVEVVLDGKYHGLYLLVETVRRDGHRVDLPKPAPTAASGDISGGYIFKMDLGQGRPGDPVPRDWVSRVSPNVYSYHYPRYDEITTAQKTYLQEHMARFETLMAGRAWNDPQKRYRAWLDVTSWVDFALVQELANNPDAYFKSVFLQKWAKSDGDKLSIGPVWDFDNGFGVADFRDARRTDVRTHSMNRFGREAVPYDPPNRVPYVPAYWDRLWTDPAFQNDLQCRWKALRSGPLASAVLIARLDGWVAAFGAAQARDGALWNNAERFDERVADLKVWLGNRLAWMDANLPGACRS